MALFAAAGLIQTVRGQGANLRLRSDLECRLNIDGQPRGVLKPGDEVRVNLVPGDHRVEAVPVTGGATWQTTVTLTEADSQEVSIPLLAAVARAEAKTRGYWFDPQSRLTWTAADNGFGVSWSQAVYYCRAHSRRLYRLDSSHHRRVARSLRRSSERRRPPRRRPHQVDWVGVERLGRSGTGRALGSRLWRRSSRLRGRRRFRPKPGAVRAP